ncbi:MAG TPA: tetratricopeptide repeat protein [Opitutaceae bacterium]|nr:tetratricopeptide repeat protein [Opitutaceae bacterium]
MSLPRHAPWWYPLVIIAAAFAAYHNSFHGPFVFDDASSIVTNPTIRKLWPPGEALSGPSTNVTAQGRPILNLSLAINHAIHGTKVEGYHVGNFLIHALAGLALFGLVRRTCDSTLALVVAVLWTVHPLQTESVTYVIQRAESLVGLFYLLTLYCFARGVGQVGDLRLTSPEGGPSGPSGPALPWKTLSVIFCLLGMATKEVMATAPLMVLFYDRAFLAGSFRAALRQRRGLYLALAGTWLLLAWLVAQGGGNRGGSVGFGVGVAMWDYWLTQFNAMARYLWLSLWPHPLVFEYGAFGIREFAEIAAPAALVLGLLGATVVGLWRRWPASFLGAWFFGILAPTSLAPGTTQMIVEHRMYLPLAAVIVAGVLAISRLGQRKAMWLGGAGAAALVLVTAGRNRDYRSDVALWSDTVAKRPGNPLAHFMLAGAQERAGNLKAALTSYGQSLELKPDFSMGHENFGALLLREGRRAEALIHFESALRLQPEYGDAHANAGNAYLAEGRIAEAVGHLEKAVELMPESAITRYNFATALATAGLGSEAVAEFEAALKRDPSMVEAHFNLANALLQSSRAAEAIHHYEAAVKMRPGYAVAHYNLANALAASGRQAEAVEHYEAALRARPDYAEAHHNLGSALYEIGRIAEAVHHYTETLRLAPDFPNAKENLERVRARMQGR